MNHWTEYELAKLNYMATIILISKNPLPYMYMLTTMYACTYILSDHEPRVKRKQWTNEQMEET